ncbi:flagellar hook-basal body complex protein FliE [Aestuariivirga sp.]|uniref:flagellar hook-basal body complex protein FliE n=1 Tax=Aestuariivirga sp. TaxID=2650926 RepID=UPI0039E37B98
MIEALKMSPLGGAGFSQSLGQAANAAKTAVANPVVDFASQLAQTVRAGESAVVSGIKGDMPLQQVVETVMTAERTLTTAVSIRDKIVSAYLETTRMQI